MVRSSDCLILLCLALAAGVSHGAQGRALFPEGAERRPEKPVLVGGFWFQPLTRSEAGGARWLYPHLDGVPEIFEEDGKGAPWRGLLESRFDPGKGEFSNLFNAAEVLNELEGEKTTAAGRAAAARLLKLFAELHDSGKPPYYLQPWLPAIEGQLDEPARAWVRERKVRHEGAVVGLAVPGVKAPDSEKGCEGYYRCMLQDGYLDISVVGGNLFNDSTGLFNSWKTMQEFLTRAGKLGFRETAFRSAKERTLHLLKTKMLGQPVVVRMNCTGGATRPDRVRRTVANFVEGLARADVFFYNGHSNLTSGVYFLGEHFHEFTKFQIGMQDTRDLRDKCHALGQKPYQLIALHSCKSYEKYARPFARHLRESGVDETRVGFLGNTELCMQMDFAPRYAALLEMLLAAKGPREILDRLDALRPHPQTPPFHARGLLQARHTFIVPKGVRIEKVADRGADRLFLIEGTGSDGKTYYSTEVFAQNAAGEIVQAAVVPQGLYGLRKDGTLAEYGAQGGSSVGELQVALDADLRFRSICAITDLGAPKLLLVGEDRRLYLRDPATNRHYAAIWQAPAEAEFVAAGQGKDGRIAVLDTKGQGYAWSAEKRRFERLGVAPDLPNLTPSLLGHGLAGELWLPANGK